MLQSVLNRLACALLIVAQDQRILYANIAARAALETGDFIRRKDEHLTTTLVERTRLARLIATVPHQAASASAMSPMPASLLLKSEKGAVRIVYVYALAAHDAGLDDRLRAPVLVVLPAVNEIHVEHTRDFAQAYGLTRTEERLLIQIVNGVTLKAAAVSMRVAGATVTTHLKHIFDKTGARRQSELVSMFLRSMPPMAF